MTVSSSHARLVYLASDGATPPYPIDFPFLDSRHVAAIHRDAQGRETPWVEYTHYTIQAFPEGGGLLSLLPGVALDAGESLVIQRAVPATQEADYQEAGRFPAETHERALDKLTMIAQQLDAGLSRALTVPASDRATSLVLPIEAERAGRFLAFDGAGRPVPALGTSGDLSPVTPFMDGLLAEGDAAGVRAALGLDGLELDPPAALPWRVFTVTGASAAFDDHVTGSGGTGATVDHDVSWMEGLWLATNLRWDADYGMLSRLEGHEDEPSLAVHLGTNGFPDIIGGFAAIAHFRVQGRAAATAAGNVHKAGLPDRLVWPAAGAVGGVEMVEIWTDQGQRAAGGSASEMDGDGAAHAYQRRVHVKLSDDGSTAVWFSGFVTNGFAAGDAVDFAAHPSVRWGLRQTLDVSGGTPAAFTTTKLEHVLQVAPPGSPPVFADVMAARLDTLDPATATGGLLLKGATVTYAAPLTTGPKAPVAHGLGGEPDFVKVVLVNLAADLGYAPGERVLIPPLSPYNGGTVGGITLKVTDTQFVVVLDVTITLPDATTGVVPSNTAIDPTKWSLEITPLRLAAG